MKSNIFGLTLAKLENLLVGEYCAKPFSAKQLWSWLYCRAAKSFDEMTNISKDLRVKLSEKYSCDRPAVIDSLVSKDNTVKWLLELEDRKRIELVYIPSYDRGTLCVSSQVGCAMGCRFCSTGSQGFSRNLEVYEIVQEVIIAKDLLEDWGNSEIGNGRKITNIVLMGMGEPLANYDNVMESMRIVNDRNGIAFSNRRITLSTCGIVPKIMDLGKEDLKLNLAISLHATTDEIRKKLMPIAEKYTLDQILEACSMYSNNTAHRRITFEYLMIEGINDSAEDAKRLVSLVRKYKIPAKFNLIPFNRWQSCPLDTRPPKNEKIRRFAEFIISAGYPCPIRLSRGQDIMAACGQLRASASSN
ncbi:MAG: 23S rRNA (adenine(2503)-C(2))-methyltransferase RlmN [Rickettsiales bacterium]|jgi:23S rRNA (adenine2503-C2)-methyltransferase|nr:23S rRNA (adenine(2503)-C(2))-methyltransferase RlmN [Rickettsiales bacterium]